MLLWIFLVLISGAVAQYEELRSAQMLSWDFEPNSDLIFYAYVVEKNLDITTHPPLQVKLMKGARLCRVQLLPGDFHRVPEFISAVVTDSRAGKAKLILNESALYDLRTRGDEQVQNGVYHLKILGEDCSQPPHHTRPWSLNVMLVPTEKPVWSERHYEFVIESTLPPGWQVGKVTAYAIVDPDVPLEQRAGDNTGMCGYKISGSERDAFDIDGHGVIRLKTSFSEIEDARVQLNVTAYDCHIPKSRQSTVSVTVLVRSGCTPHWEDVPQSLTYGILASPRLVAPEARLNVCIPSDAVGTLTAQFICHPKETALRVKILWSEEDTVQFRTEQPTTCDLDVLSLRAQRKFCGVSSEFVAELLPHRQNSVADFQELNPFLGVHYFNGSYQWVVNDDQLPLSKHRLDDTPFTLSFWMKHAPKAHDEETTTKGEENGKENILCNADEEEKNRHHFAVYLHDCKLTVLLRREPADKKGELYQLFPSQWRFNVPEVCDSQWHHYSLVYHQPPKEVVEGLTTQSEDWNVNTELKLFIDGVEMPSDPDMLRIAEDVPLRQLKHRSKSTRLSVGACWHARSSHFVQHFSGSLAGLTLAHGEAQTSDQIQCVLNCQPRLYIADRSLAGNTPTMMISLRQSHLDNLIVQANNLSELTETLRRVAVYNPRLYRKPMDRPEPIGIQLNTLISYEEKCANKSVPDETIYIHWLPPTDHMMQSLELRPAADDDHLALQGVRKTVPLPSEYVHRSLVIRKRDRYPAGLPIEISSPALLQGVWLFPSFELSWEFDEPLAKSESFANNPVSYCEVRLCGEDSTEFNSLKFQAKETVTLGDNFLDANLHLKQSATGPRVSGPADVMTFTKVIEHFKWFNLEPSHIDRRCFALTCAAEVNVSNSGQQLPNRIIIQSNTVQSTFTVRQTREMQRFARKSDEHVPVSVHSQNDATIPDHVLMNDQPVAAAVQEHQELRYLGKEEPKALRSTSVDSPPKQDTQTTFILLGCATVMFLAAVAVGTMYLIRSKHPRTHSSTESWEPVNSCPNGGRANEGGLRSQGCHGQNRLSRTKVIINPLTNAEELKELETKVCYYNRRLYDDDLDAVNNSSIPGRPNIPYADSPYTQPHELYDVNEEDVAEFDSNSDDQSVKEVVKGPDPKV
ncbi:unnamed protein product [Calicophoron daubneyi]|uniref:Cadherin domain-containing protein n=1 Tax=Calicophoron daubneyi TaxID=300641 RepID=A0AAV2TJP0_CALDB